MQHNRPFTKIGKTNWRGRKQDFGIYTNDRLHHIWILGQTGVGKSSLMLNMMRQDLERRVGFCLLDPHGDLAEELLPFLGEDAIYLDLANPNNKYGYNPLLDVPPQYRPLLASNLIESFKQQWRDAWGVRMEHLLRNALLALLDQGDSTLADIVPLCTDKDFRERLLHNIQNQQVRDFWQDEYPKLNYKNAFDGVAPIANKLGALLSHPLVRKALCEPEIHIDLGNLMDEGIPCIINLSKGRLGADTSNVVGGMFLGMLASHAYRRSQMPPSERRAYFIYADEFHNFSTQALSLMLPELRKYKLGLLLAHQHLSQLHHSVLDALLGNCGTQIVFRLGAQDATLMSKHLGWQIMEADVVNLPNFHYYIKLMIDGCQSKSFSAITGDSRVG